MSRQCPEPHFRLHFPPTFHARMLGATPQWLQPPHPPVGGQEQTHQHAILETSENGYETQRTSRDSHQPHHAGLTAYAHSHRSPAADDAASRERPRHGRLRPPAPPRSAVHRPLSAALTPSRRSRPPQAGPAFRRAHGADDQAGTSRSPLSAAKTCASADSGTTRITSPTSGRTRLSEWTVTRCGALASPQSVPTGTP